MNVYTKQQGSEEPYSIELAHLNEANMRSKESDDVKICGNCKWIKKPRKWVIQRLKYCANAGLSLLLKEMDSLRRQRYWCTREGFWSHLLDDACSFWEPDDPANKEKE